jgi:hypothetical protein
LNNDFGIFAEQFSFISNYQPRHNVDLGVFYLLNNNLQLDFYAGTFIFNNTPKNSILNSFFVGAGVSYKIQP